MKQQLLLYCFLFNFIVILGVHQYRFSHITTKDGLPHSLVYDISQDNRGFIWFATNNGLARYDGYTFKVFLPSYSNPHSISNKAVSLVFSDMKNNLWLSMQGRGLNQLDVATEKFKSYLPDSTIGSGIIGNHVYYIWQDTDSVIWIGTNKDINRYEYNKEGFYGCFEQHKNNKFIKAGTRYFFKDNFNRLWFLSTKGVGYINTKDLSVHPIEEFCNIQSNDSLQIKSMKPDGLNNLWLATKNNGLIKLDLRTRKLTSFLGHYKGLDNLFVNKNNDLFVSVNKPENKIIVLNINNPSNCKEYKFKELFDERFVLHFEENQNGEIWLSTNEGLYNYSFYEGFTKYDNNIYDQTTVSGSNVVTIFIDRSNVLWVSQSKVGVDKSDLFQKPFNTFYHNPEEINSSISGNIVTAVYEDSKNNLWVGSFQSGVTFIDSKRQHFRTIPLDFGKNNCLNGSSPATFKELNDGSILLGFLDMQIDKIHIPSFKISHFSKKEKPPYYFEGYAIRKIIMDKDENIWITSNYKGLVEFNKAKQDFIYHSELYEKDYDNNNIYRTVYIDRYDSIWMGTQNGGLSVYNKYTHEFKHYLNDPKDPFSISSNVVYTIYCENDSIIWVGTAGGLNKFNRITRKFVTIGNKSNQLPNNTVYSFLPDKKGNYWISTDNGLCRFNPRLGIYTNFFESDGLPSNEFNSGCYTIGHNGTMYFGTTKGLLTFDPNQIVENQIKSKPIISDLKIDNEIVNPGDTIKGTVVLQKPIWMTSQLELSYKTNEFTLEFSALNFAAPEKVKYYYILEGFNEDWIERNANQRYANYTGLPHGDYTFRLRATNNDGILNDPENDIVLKIHIEPPFWKALWFDVLVVFFLTTIIFFYIRFRLKEEEKSRKLLEDKVHERTYELEDAKNRLEENNINLEEKQEEINVQKEKLTKQRDSLENKNRMLLEQQRYILEQNIVLENHQNHLENLVEERTKELAKALNKAKESDELKGSFLANMSHEIRTPMNAIIGFSSLLADNDISNAEKGNFIRIIQRSGQSLMVLINDILDLSKIQAGQMILKTSIIPIEPLLLELDHTFKLLAQESGSEIILTYSPKIKEIQLNADRVRLKQVLTNLLANAIKFTMGGKIEFGVCDINSFVTFFVKDNGIGIPYEAGNSIFDRFTKIETDKNNIFGGTGLGLSICKNLIDLWGGDIWYESVIEQGTIFYFTHPIANLKIEKLTLKDMNNTEATFSLEGKTILIAEDNEDNYRLLQTYLMRTKVNVVWAHNGKEAINSVTSQKIDLVLMDVKMPIMDGLEATRQIKALFPNIPIIVQTAFAFENEKEQFINAGADGFVIKPIRRPDLMDAITNYFNID